MTSLPTKPSILAIVGEAYGEQEERTHIPFIGQAGQELTKMLRDAGIDRSECLLTNTFNLRPPNNDLKSFCGKKAEVSELYLTHRPRLLDELPDYDWPAVYNWAPLAGAGKFLHPRYLTELVRLKRELTRPDIHLVIALGNTACWGLLGRTGIGKLRGYVYNSTLVTGLRVLPTYHPASILRQYANRPIVVADFQKAIRERSRLISGGNPEPASKRVLWIEPDEADLENWWRQYVSYPWTRLSVDIETHRGTITCIGFGVEACGLSIPFSSDPNGSGNYWPDQATEERVLGWVCAKLAGPNPKIFQNALYDLQWIWRKWGQPVNRVEDDTMLIHHALQPEMPKDLGFLGSVYTEEVAWKSLRHQAHLKAKAEKRDE